jgi:hypothetical protein
MESWLCVKSERALSIIFERKSSFGDRKARALTAPSKRGFGNGNQVPSAPSLSLVGDGEELVVARGRLFVEFDFFGGLHSEGVLADPMVASAVRYLAARISSQILSFTLAADRRCTAESSRSEHHDDVACLAAFVALA